MDESNPFAIGTESARAEPAAPDSRYEQLGRMFVRWEKLRMLYNAALVLWTLLWAVVFGPRLLLDVSFWDACVFGALGANACFCCGPLLEGYLTWFFRSHIAVTGVLFTSGTLLSLLLATASVAAFSFGMFH